MKSLVNILLLVLAGLTARPIVAQVNADFVNTSPSVKFREMDEAIRNKEYSNIHSVLVMHKGKLVFEQYYEGKDESWGDDLGIIDHKPDSLHDIRSITKSVVSICVGLAIQQGKIKNVNEKVMSFFPAFRAADTGWRSSLTIKDLLVMSSGIEWNENLPYTDSMNSEIRMSVRSDPTAFILSQPIIFQPGTKWNYNGGNTQLIAAVIEKTCGMPIDKFAYRYLFQPLGITRYFWYHMPENNIVAAASGLRLSSRDMLKVGELLLNEGIYYGKRLLPAEWVKASLTSHIDRGDGGGYGYQFWVFKAPGSSNELPAAVGNGDQRIFIDKANQLLVVITAGNYNQWDLTKASYELLRDFIYQGIQ